LLLKDVESSLQKFSGDNLLGVSAWLVEFEKMAKFCGWTDVHKVVFAKALLTGSAQIFMRRQGFSTSWTDFRKTLKEEFEEVVVDHQIHRQPSQKKKLDKRLKQQGINARTTKYTQLKDKLEEPEVRGLKKKSEEKDVEDPENGNEGKQETESINKKDEKAQNETSGIDQTQSVKQDVQAMDVDKAECSENVEADPLEENKAPEINKEVSQEDNPDREGVDQSQIKESKTEYQGKTNAGRQGNVNDDGETKKERKRNPVKTDTDRTLDDTSQPVKKKMKTVIVHEKEIQTTEDDGLVQQVKEAKLNDEQILDSAIVEQADDMDLSNTKQPGHKSYGITGCDECTKTFEEDREEIPRKSYKTRKKRIIHRRWG
jgi:hypothetical protein